MPGNLPVPSHSWWGMEGMVKKWGSTTQEEEHGSISKETKAWPVLLQETSKHEQQDASFLGKLGENPDAGRQTPHVLSHVWVLASDLYMYADVGANVYWGQEAGKRPWEKGERGLGAGEDSWTHELRKPRSEQGRKAFRVMGRGAGIWGSGVTPNWRCIKKPWGNLIVLQIN